MKRSRFRYLAFILAGVLVLGLSSIAFGQDSAAGNQLISKSGDTHPAGTALEGTIFLHTGSPLILSGDKISSLDPENLDVAATVIGSRTLVPLRSLAEYFGAEVSYDAKERTAVILYNDQKYLFPVGKNFYRIGDGEKAKTVFMDTQARILQDRTMVPLRAICEEILLKKVAYRDGVIAISSKTVDLGSDTGLVTQVKSRIGAALKAQSKAELARLLAPVAAGSYYGKDSIAVPRTGIPEKQEASANEAADSNGAAPSMDAGTGSDSSASDYSQTNTQVMGIDEADIVKTDGKYIYIAGNNAVRIVRADKSDLSEAAVIKLPDQKTVQEIYVDGNRLVLLGNRYENSAIPYVKSGGSDAEDAAVSMDSIVSSDMARIMPPYYSKTYSFADVYDISDPGKPGLLKSHEMEGYYQTSRKSGSHVYLATNSYVYGDIAVPLMRDTAVSSQAFQVAVDDIMIMPDCRAPGYVVLSAIDITDDSKTKVEAITAAGYQMYMNESSIYFSGDSYDGSTTITRFKIDGMNMGYAGTGKVKGTILNQFSMDEYQGSLRIATTTWENDNALYVLNDSLNVIGSVTGLAKGERIYSVRFLGDKGYIVTFRSIDPLFVFDLSQPESPKLTGELKVPGFSNYLHPIGDGLILGIGADTQEIYTKDSKGNETVIGTRQGGIKVSLFDVSDMGKPREVTNYVIGDSGSYTEASYNHKAIMVDPANQKIAFDAYIADGKDWNQSKQGALVISYQNRQITQKGLLAYTQPEVYGKYIPFGKRTVYIGNTLYYVQDGIVKAYDYNSLKQLSSLELK